MIWTLSGPLLQFLRPPSYSSWNSPSPSIPFIQKSDMCNVLEPNLTLLGRKWWPWLSSWFQSKDYVPVLSFNFWSHHRIRREILHRLVPSYFKNPACTTRWRLESRWFAHQCTAVAGNFDFSKNRKMSQIRSSGHRLRNRRPPLDSEQYCASSRCPWLSETR